MEFQLIYSFFLSICHSWIHILIRIRMQCYGFRTKNSGSGSKNFETGLVFESKNRQSEKIICKVFSCPKKCCTHFLTSKKDEQVFFLKPILKILAHSCRQLSQKYNLKGKPKKNAKIKNKNLSIAIADFQ